MLRLLLVAGLVAAAGPCAADDFISLLPQAFGNTILITYPDGRSGQLWLQSDGAYTAEGRDHDRSNGRWRVRDGRLCFKQAHPFAFGYVYCTLLSQLGGGSSWVARAVTGEMVKIRLVRESDG
jgi:hypothetical protein